MSLSAPPVTDTRLFFRPVSLELVSLLRGLAAADWDRPTVAGSWQVRDVVAHLLDTSMRRLSFQRDRHDAPLPDRPLAGERDFVAFINELNRKWVAVARRFSPRVLSDLYAHVSSDLASFVESLPLEGPALFPVSWAGDAASARWFDIGREFTEQWHHQMQIRDAVGAPPLGDPAWLHALLSIAVRALPHGYRNTRAPEEASVTLEMTGPAGGVWTLIYSAGAWSLWAGATERPTTKATLQDDCAWRLFFNALSEREARSRVTIEGDSTLAEPLLRARSVIV